MKKIAFFLILTASLTTMGHGAQCILRSSGELPAEYRLTNDNLPRGVMLPENYNQEPIDLFPRTHHPKLNSLRAEARQPWGEMGTNSHYKILHSFELPILLRTLGEDSRSYLEDATKENLLHLLRIYPDYIIGGLRQTTASSLVYYADTALGELPLKNLLAQHTSVYHKAGLVLDIPGQLVLKNGPRDIHSTMDYLFLNRPKFLEEVVYARDFTNLLAPNNMMHQSYNTLSTSSIWHFPVYNEVWSLNHGVIHNEDGSQQLLDVGIRGIYLADETSYSHICDYEKISHKDLEVFLQTMANDLHVPLYRIPKSPKRLSTWQYKSEQHFIED